MELRRITESENNRFHDFTATLEQLFDRDINSIIIDLRAITLKSKGWKLFHQVSFNGLTLNRFKPNMREKIEKGIFVKKGTIVQFRGLLMEDEYWHEDLMRKELDLCHPNHFEIVTPNQETPQS